MTQSLEQAEAWLGSLIDVERLPDLRRARLSLAPMRRLLAALDHPDRGLRILHIAGSKGKGSTALLAEALLCGLGRRVGTFTSPHLSSWTERFRIDGVPAEGAVLARAVERLQPIASELRAGPDAPSFFDVTTAAALLLFAEARVDVAILEVGLGGRLDSTNVVQPTVTCITTVEREHTEKLGDTLAAIAGEKAGIVKPGVPLVMGPLAPEAVSVVEARCAAQAAPLLRLGKEIGFTLLEGGGAVPHAVRRSPGSPDTTSKGSRVTPTAAPTGARFRLDDAGLRVEPRLGVLGDHQAVNAALALACVHRLGVAGAKELGRVALRALADARLPGRIEVLSSRPWVVVDGAHTPVSARALAETLAALPHRRCVLLLSVSAGKELTAILDCLRPLADAFVVTRAEPHRSLSPSVLAEALARGEPAAPIRVVEEPREAVRLARRSCGPEDLLCVTGSIYLAGVARPMLAAPAASVRPGISTGAS